MFSLSLLLSFFFDVVVCTKHTVHGFNEWPTKRTKSTQIFSSTIRANFCESTKQFFPFLFQFYVFCFFFVFFSPRSTSIRLRRVCINVSQWHEDRLCALKSKTFHGNRIFHYFWFWSHSSLISKTMTPWRWKEYWRKSLELCSNRYCFFLANNRSLSANLQKQ